MPVPVNDRDDCAVGFFQSVYDSEDIIVLQVTKPWRSGAGSSYILHRILLDYSARFDVCTKPSHRGVILPACSACSLHF
jgi:hypothetical protein